MRYLFSDRFGGVSKAPFASLNLALHVEDDFRDVEKNREILAEKIETNRLIFMEQIHKDHIEIVTDATAQELLGTDAMISDIKGIGLCVMVADCIPILFYDSIKKVIAVAHAGRQGVALNIANKVIESMIHNFASKVENIEIFMGPGIKSCCYEVKKDAIEGFENYSHVHKDKIYLDIEKKCIDDMLKIGIVQENISSSSICTCCDQRYFSYRRDGKTGRFCGVITL